MSILDIIYSYIQSVYVTLLDFFYWAPVQMRVDKCVMICGQKDYLRQVQYA